MPQRINFEDCTCGTGFIDLYEPCEKCNTDSSAWSFWNYILGEIEFSEMAEYCRINDTVNF